MRRARLHILGLAGDSGSTHFRRRLGVLRAQIGTGRSPDFCPGLGVPERIRSMLGRSDQAGSSWQPGSL